LKGVSIEESTMINGHGLVKHREREREREREGGLGKANALKFKPF